MKRDPCNGCTQRTITCHFEGQCEKYQQFRERTAQINDTRRKQNDILAYTVRAMRQSQGRERWF